jgi:hypothetical protein
MRGIANGTQVTALPTPAAAVGAPGYCNNTAPGPGVTPTDLYPDDVNIILAELLGILAAAGVTQDATGANTTQVLASLKTLFRGNNILAKTATGTWTVPAGVTSVHFRGWSAGGGGAGMGNGGAGGGGGGQGGAYFEGIATVTPGAVITCTVGASGAGGTNVSGSYNGSIGGTTSFGTFATATGGSGGAGFANGTGGGGYGNGVATGGTVNITGTSGQNGISVSTAFLGGMGGGTFGTGSTYNGSGGGPTGNFPGGGGGGGTQNSAGGAGGAGLLILEW